MPGGRGRKSVMTVALLDPGGHCRAEVWFYGYFVITGRGLVPHCRFVIAWQGQSFRIWSEFVRAPAASGERNRAEQRGVNHAKVCRVPGWGHRLPGGPVFAYRVCRTE